MKTSFFSRATAFILVLILILPTFSSCVRKITLDDAKYTMEKLFSAIGEGDYDAAVKLMYNSSEITSSRIESFLSEVEDKSGGSFSEGITNIRYTSYAEEAYSGVPSGSIFRVHGTMNIGSAQNVPFTISLFKSSEGYGVSVFDIDGIAL